MYYQKGTYTKALPFIQAALRTNSKNPVLLCRAGLIYEKNCDKAKAKGYQEQAIKINPNLPQELRQISEQALKAI